MESGSRMKFLRLPDPMAPWDQVALTQQVSDRALTSLNVQSHGRLAAVGDAGGWGTAPKNTVCLRLGYPLVN